MEGEVYVFVLGYLGIERFGEIVVLGFLFRLFNYWLWENKFNILGLEIYEWDIYLVSFDAFCKIFVRMVYIVGNMW